MIVWIWNCPIDTCTYRVAPNNGAIFVRLNFTKYYPIFKIISLTGSGENS